MKVVMGAHYGDEGKGRAVNWLTSQAQADPIIVRHNSGAQAGHTVQHGGARHVFSHFGSGTLQGAETLLCHKFVANPIIFNQEYDELAKIGVKPKTWIGLNVLVSTPIDAFLNQLMESTRGDGRHGSCGVGFGETIYRSEVSPQLNVFSLQSDPDVEALARYALNEVDRRKIDVSRASDTLRRVYGDLRGGTFKWEPWIRHLDLFKSRVHVLTERSIGELLANPRHEKIFEGAQGLRLHQGDIHEFPHVTRSRTGLEDVVELLNEHRVETELEPYYCSRTYLTRHGAGRLKYEASLELMGNLGYDINDPTNVENQFQGQLRFSPIIENFDYVALDLMRAQNMGGRIKPATVIVSCCDQAPSTQEVDRVAAKAAIHASSILLGWGPNSADTERWNGATNVGSAVEDVVEAKEPTNQEQKPGSVTAETTSEPVATEETTPAEA